MDGLELTRTDRPPRPGEDPHDGKLEPQRRPSGIAEDRYDHEELDLSDPAVQEMRCRAVERESAQAGPAVVVADRIPYFWLDPRLAILHAEAMVRELTSARPEAAAVFRSNLSGLSLELQDADRRIRRSLKRIKGSCVLTLLADFRAFLGRYGLCSVSVEAGPNLIEDLERLSRDREASTLLVPPGFSAHNLDALGLTVVELDPLAGDYPDQLERAARAIAAAGWGEDEAQHDRAG
jgi:ABC-type Zn uptake system ZnuABC Zn-binding protein ZnuA